jgi:hypothetical protein
LPTSDYQIKFSHWLSIFSIFGPKSLKMKNFFNIIVELKIAEKGHFF